MANLNHKIELSTNLLGHFINHGYYETYVGEQLGFVDPRNKAEAIDAIGELTCEIITEALYDNLPVSIDDGFEIKYIGTYSPAYYNFETDSVEFEFSYSDGFKEFVDAMTKDHKERFSEFLKKHYTSRDGFISFVSNDYNEIREGILNDDSKSVSTALRWLLETRCCEEDYIYSFDEKAWEIINEQYIDSEYCIEYESGYTVICEYIYVNTKDYDGDKFIARLFDAEHKEIAREELEDSYFELNHSAYAAYEYNMEYDLCGDVWCKGSMGYGCKQIEKPSWVPEI